MNFILQWIDVIWLLLAAFIVYKQHRWLAVAFVAGCMVMMRLQVEMMESINHARGIIGLMDSHVFTRALCIYSVFYMTYLILAHYSPNTRPIIFAAASISLFFIVLFASTVVMVL